MLFRYLSISLVCGFILPQSGWAQSGELIVETVDNFSQHTHQEKFFIESNGTRIQVKPSNVAEARLLDGKQVSLNSSTGILSSKNIFTPQPSGIYEQTQKMLVIFATYPDSTPLTERSDGREILRIETLKSYLNTRSFKSYFDVTYQKKLYNHISHVAAYQFQKKCTEKVYSGANYGYVTAADAKQIFLDLNLNPRDFNSISVLSNCPGNGWGIASSALIDGYNIKTSHVTLGPGQYHYGTSTDLVPWLSLGGNFTDVLIHERLHNLGVNHANGLDCQGKDFLYPCSHNEYGNPFDLMGRRMSSFGLNAHQLKRANIRSDHQFMLITSPGVYTINALESTNPNAIIGAYIQSPDMNSPAMMVEHRLPLAMDRTLLDPALSEVKKGLLLYSSINTGTAASASYSTHEYRIMDPNQGRFDNLTFLDRLKDQSLNGNKVFFDPMTGIRISQVRLGAPLQSNSARAPGNTPLVNDQINFKVEFDHNAKICYKTLIRNDVEPLFFEVNGVAQSPDATPSVTPGDVVVMRVNTRQTDNIICPRETITVKVNNTDEISTWVPGQGDGPIEPGSPTPIRNSETNGVSSIERSFFNTETSSVFYATLTVPADARVGLYELPVSYLNKRNGQSFNSTLKIRVTEKSRTLKK